MGSYDSKTDQTPDEYGSVIYLGHGIAQWA